MSGADRTILTTPLHGGAVMRTIGDGTGPTVAVLGGVHGDEDEGVLAAQRLGHELVDRPLRGTLRIVAPAHPAAWAAAFRTSPLDGGNLARAFPGDAALGPTSALAASITAHVIEGSDLVIDLHSAGVRYSMPRFVGYSIDGACSETAQKAAVSFGTSVVWEHRGVPPGRSLSTASDLGIPGIYVECGGGGSVRARDLDAYVDGVMNVLALQGMLEEGQLSVQSAPRIVRGSGDLDGGAAASVSGYFVSRVEAGDLVAPDTVIGYVYDHDGGRIADVRAAREGMIMFLRRQARVQPDDVLYVLAEHGPEDRQ